MYKFVAFSFAPKRASFFVSLNLTEADVGEYGARFAKASEVIVAENEKVFEKCQVPWIF